MNEGSLLWGVVSFGAIAALAFLAGFGWLPQPGETVGMTDTDWLLDLLGWLFQGGPITLFTFVLAIATIVQAVVLRQQWTVGKDTAKAAADAADAAKKQAEVAERTMLATTRAWLGVAGWEVVTFGQRLDEPNLNHIEIAFNIENSGTIAARVDRWPFARRCIKRSR
jgi:hypothetical protein